MSRAGKPRWRKPSPLVQSHLAYHGLIGRILIYGGSNLTVNRDARLDIAAWIPGGTQPVPLGGDKNFDPRAFVSKLCEAAVVPHVAQNQHERRNNAMDERTTRHEAYAISQQKCKPVEEIFAWIKPHGWFFRNLLVLVC